MHEVSRTQIAVYGAVAVALLLVGARAIRTDSGPEPALAGAAQVGGGDGDFSFQPSGGGDVVVDVAGEVRRPGVYRLPEGARVTDAIERAGGPTASALVEGVNRAAELADGQQVVIPAAGSGGVAAASIAGEDGPISLGTATAEQLDGIEGIGEVTAEKILEFRDERGGLASVEQLDQVSGIGPATMEALRSRLQP